LNSPSIEAWVFGCFWAQFLLFLADTWSSKFIVDTFPLEIKVEKLAESLRKDTFLEKSLPVVTFEAVDLLVLESEPMFSSSLSPEENKAKVEEAEILFEEYLVI